MSKIIQIGNLGDFMDGRHLARLFAPFGEVHSANVSTHFTTGQNTGVGFVEMVNDDEGESAIVALHGHTHGDRILSVCWSNPSPPPDEAGPRMFKSMNVTDEAVGGEEQPERRGLP
jgi:RNA recognition motif-containing protein